MANPCSVCGEEMVPDTVYVCGRPHAVPGAVIASAIHACPLEKGAIWVHVIDDARANVAGVSVTNSAAGKKDSDGSGFAPFDPLDEGDDYKITLNALSDSLSKNYRLPAVVDVEKVPVKKGQITSVQLQLERVAPLKVIVKRSDNDEFVKAISVEVTTTNARNSPQLPTQTTHDGAAIEFPKLAKGSYRVALKLSDEDKAQWRVLDLDTQDWVMDTAPGKSNEVTFKLTPIIRIYLKPQFKDPEDNVRPFPKDFKFNLVFEAGAEPRKREIVVDETGIATADGKAFVEVERAAKSFKIDLKQPGGVSVVCEKRGAARTQELVAEVDPEAGLLAVKLRAEGRMFRLPLGDWTLLNSRWDVVETSIKGGASLDPTDYRFKDFDPLAAEIGSAGAPVVLTLRPAWQLLRFVYYDRKLKGDDPLSVPSKPYGDVIPLVMEGWRAKADEIAGTPADVKALWPLGDDDTKNVVCLPWIVGKGGSNDDVKVKPDKDTILRFKRRETHPFIHTVSATDRRLVDVGSDSLRNEPSVMRLAYYDLPKVWKSRGYFGWLSDADGDWGPYEDVAEKDTSPAKPLVFSLDDMVLTNDTLAPVVTPWDKTTRVALLSHLFAGTDTEPAGGTGPVVVPPDNGKPQKPTPKGGRRWLNDLGLYNADLSFPELSYFSKVRMNVNYVADYPHWTRLVVMGGNLFEVFDQRTPNHASDVVGARAAVRWVDAVTGNPPEAALSARPPLTRKNFFGFQAYVNTEYPKRLTDGSPTYPHVPYSHSRPAVDNFGRFDFALLRCCDIDGATERAVHLVYYRLFFKFVARPGSVIFNDPADKNYARDYVVNVGRRYNGKTGFVGADPAERVKFLPRLSTTEPIEVDHVWFGQSLPKAQCQFSITVEEPRPGTLPRAYFNGLEGTGSHGPGHQSDAGGQAGFTGAHECGHGVGLTDDYCERWNAQSHGELSFRWHLPGDPFEADGRITEYNQPQAAMMNGNSQIRNRYAWHCAEWSRRVSTVPFKVKLGAHADYWLPAHPSNDRNYAFWPFAARETYRLAPPADNRASASLALYAMGKEVYTDGGLQTSVCGSRGSPDAFDGMLTISIHLAMALPNYTVVGSADRAYHEGDKRKKLLSAVSALVRDGLNGRFFVQGTVNGRRFERALIHFSPRFLDMSHHGLPAPSSWDINPVSLAQQRASAATYARQLGRDFGIIVKLDDTPAGRERFRWEAKTPEIADIQSLVDWKAATRASTGDRVPEDAQLSELDAAIEAYHTLHTVSWTARRDKLREIEVMASAWEAARDAAAVLTPETPENLARRPGVAAMRAAARGRHMYMTATRASRNLELMVKRAPAVGAQLLADLVPTMIGIYKPMSEVVAPDLQGLVRELLPDGTVSLIS